MTSRLNLVRENSEAIKALVKEINASNIRIFGSVARGEETPTSDIDFIVDFDISNGFWDVICLEGQLERLLGVECDVHAVATLKQNVLIHALQDAVTV